MSDRSVLVPLSEFAARKKVSLYLVGGYLRDLILKRRRSPPDFDFAVEKNAIAFGRAAARHMKAGFVVLDREHGSCRVVLKVSGQTYTLDFTDFRGASLQEDLLRRDFTVNALAADLAAFLAAPSFRDALIDVCGSLKDLKAGVIRVPSPGVFEDDPVRILRAFSFSAQLGFAIEEKTLRLAARQRALLANASSERLRDELFRMFASSHSWKQLAAMDKAGVLEMVIPEISLMRKVSQGPYHHLDVLAHSMESVKQLELLMEKTARAQDDVREYVSQELSTGRTRLSLMKLACLLHDIGKPEARRKVKEKIMFYGHERVGAAIALQVCRRLKLSNDEISALRTLVFWHLRPGYLGDQKKVTPHAAFRFFRDTGKEAASTLLLSLADQRSTKGPLTTPASARQHERTCNALLKEYFAAAKAVPMVRLIDGNDLMKRFKLEPSPLIGKVLAHLQEQQALRKIKTAAQAYQAAARFLAKNR